MSRVSFEWGMSHMDESRSMWLNNLFIYRIMSQRNESCLIWMSRVSYDRGVSRSVLRSILGGWKLHTWMSHVSHEWVASHIWMSYASFCIAQYTWGLEIAHIWMSHVSHEWAASHMNESCLVLYCAVYLDTGNGTHEWVMSHVNASRLMWMCHVSCLCCAVHSARDLEIQGGEDS